MSQTNSCAAFVCLRDWRSLQEVMPLAIGVLKGVDFETRKDLVVLFNYLVRCVTCDPSGFLHPCSMPAG